MRLYNIEIFDPELNYRSSAQTSSFEYSFDYMDIEKNILTVPKIIAKKGDYIRVTAGAAHYSGIVSDVTIGPNFTELQYKPFHKIFDVNIMATAEESSVEATLAKWLSDYYVINDDVFQRIATLNISTTSATPGSLLEGPGVINVYDMVLQALTYYGIVCNFEINVQAKTLDLTIGMSTAQTFTIEADLASVVDKVITIKEADESVNKLVIYNEEDPAETAVYYLTQDNEITQDPDSRVVPVTCEVATVKVPGTSTFDEQALKKAQTVLKPSEYDNLIEIEVLANDKLVRPEERVIGQKCNVIVAGQVFSTVLTGQIVNERIRLIFGAIRLELTKQLKKRFRQEDTR